MAQNIKSLKNIINTIMLGFFILATLILVYYFNNSDKLITFLLVITIALVPAYTFLVKPLYYFFTKEKNIIDEKLRDLLLKKGFDSKIKIISLKTHNSSFTSGSIPFLKIILIEKTLIDSLSYEDLEAIIYYELGHIEKNHLIIQYLLNLTLTIICYISFTVKSNILDIYINGKVFEALTVFITGALIGCLFVYVPLKIKYLLDNRADLFASKKVGMVNYIRALNNLDNIMDDNIYKSSGLTGIRLLRRINNIKANSYEV